MAGTFEKRLSYYYIRHFSHFIVKCAVQIATTTFSNDVSTAAFQSPDGKIVAVLLNSSSKKRRMFFRVNGQLIELPMEADAIITVEIKA